MPPSRNITDFFKRPHFSSTVPETPIANRKNAADSPAAACQTSHLTEPPSSSLSNCASPQSPDSSACQLKDGLWDSMKDAPEEEVPAQSFQSVDTTATREQSAGTSFTSQRMVKNGKEVVISSDGEDTDSIESLEDPDQLLSNILGPSKDEKDKGQNGDNGNMSLRSRDPKTPAKPYKLSALNSKPPKYKNTLDSLVTAAVDDNETEANVAKLKAALESEKNLDLEPAHGDFQVLNENILTANLDDPDDEQGFQRLIEAVRRTEAFDHEKMWFFFDKKDDVPSGPEFPRDSIAPGTFMAVLREPDSRERAFHSGVIEFALSRGFLPDELIIWIFHSVPSESRDNLRQAYCRIFKNVTAERVKFLIRPDDVDMLFRRLGASSKALALSEPIAEEANYSTDSLEKAKQKKAVLISVLGLLRGAADLFAEDTRERILCILLRMSLDISLTGDAVICSELERAITAMFEGVPEDKADDLANNTSSFVYETVNNAAFQGRLLKHILPTSSWIALFRCRLAVAFLTRSPTPLTEPAETLLDIKRITNVLKDQRFNVKLHKQKGYINYDYGELLSITILLNIAIDPGWSGFDIPKEAARDFNAGVDALADRIKMIFSSIEDSGASHLKRTLAKENLEALHYRIVYSIRTRPPPKKTLFISHERRQDDNPKITNFVQRVSNRTKTEETNMPIRGAENTS